MDYAKLSAIQVSQLAKMKDIFSTGLYSTSQSIHEIDKEKHPDHLADSCKHSSANRMAAGSRLSRSSHGFFLLSPLFQTHFL